MNILLTVANHDKGFLNTMRFMSEGFLYPNKAGNAIIVPVMYSHLAAVTNLLSFSAVTVRQFFNLGYQVAEVTRITTALKVITVKLFNCAWCLTLGLLNTPQFKIASSILIGLKTFHILGTKRTLNPRIHVQEQLRFLAKSIQTIIVKSVKVPFYFVSKTILSSAPWKIMYRLRYPIVILSTYSIIANGELTLNMFIQYVLLIASKLK